MSGDKWKIGRIFGETSFGPTRWEPLPGGGYQAVTPVYDRGRDGKVVSVTEHRGIVLYSLLGVGTAVS